MTTPTGPDDDRLRASTAGQEGRGQWILDEGARAREFLRGFPEGALPVVTYPPGHGPAPQQPPAQGRESFACCSTDPADACNDCPKLPARMFGKFAPPSEVDSASEPWRVGSHYGIHVYCGDRPVATFHDATDAERAVRDHNAGVRGGDDQARERLADVLALHVPWYEIDGVRHDNLVTIGCGSYQACDGNDQFWCTEADEHPHEVPACYECRCVIDGDLEGHLLWPCPTVRAAGGGR